MVELINRTMESKLKFNNKIYRNMSTKYNLLLLLIIGFWLQACNNDTSQMPVRNELKLTASEKAIVLDKEKADEIALTFSWNKATDIGDEYSFSYLFQIDIADNDFATATEYVVLGENESFSFTAMELYDLILEDWRMEAGKPIEIEARVAARVEGPKFVYPEIAKTRVEVTTFTLDSRPIYMVGSATNAGTNPALAIPMTEISNGRLYEWQGKLNVGNLKFTTSLESLFPSYNFAGDLGEHKFSITECIDENGLDEYFEITQAGSYYITLSFRKMTTVFQQLKYENIFVVGDGCDAGWDFKITMTQNKTNFSLYTYEGNMKEGELKFITGSRWEDPTFRPLTANAPIESGPVQLISEPDLKWKITSDKTGKYLITLDVDELYIKFEKQ